MVDFIPGYENVLRKIFNESLYSSLGFINSDFGIKYAFYNNKKKGYKGKITLNV